MAGDWLKIELVTPDKQEVWAMAEALSLDPDAVVGKLFRVWRWFDQHSEEGNARSVSKSLLDREVGVTGFCGAMQKVRWMEEKNGFIAIPNFDKHNGKSAKNRANTAKRVAKHKALAGSNGDSVSTVTVEALPKEEKRREENKDRFVKPTPEEIQTYCDERGNGLSGEKIFDHYEANGWMRGKTKIKDWKACVRTWEKNTNTDHDEDEIFRGIE